MPASHPRRTRPSTAKLQSRLLQHFLVVLAILVVSLAIGMWGYMRFAGLGWVDAFMNAAMLLGGMGPVAILDKDPAKVFAGLYALYAGLVFIVSTGILVAPLAHHLLKLFNADDDEPERR